MKLKTFIKGTFIFTRSIIIVWFTGLKDFWTDKDITYTLNATFFHDKNTWGRMMTFQDEFNKLVEKDRQGKLKNTKYWTASFGPRGIPVKSPEINLSAPSWAFQPTKPVKHKMYTNKLTK